MRATTTNAGPFLPEVHAMTCGVVVVGVMQAHAHGFPGRSRTRAGQPGLIEMVPGDVNCSGDTYREVPPVNSSMSSIRRGLDSAELTGGISRVGSFQSRDAARTRNGGWVLQFRNVGVTHNLWCAGGISRLPRNSGIARGNNTQVRCLGAKKSIRIDFPNGRPPGPYTGRLIHSAGCGWAIQWLGRISRDAGLWQCPASTIWVRCPGSRVIRSHKGSLPIVTSGEDFTKKEGTVVTNQFNVRLIGQTPLLMHNDNLTWAEVMAKWSLDPANKKNSVAGDDRSPACRWIGNLYTESGKVVIPSDNIMTVLREGGAKCPTGKRGGTFKRQTQSGLVVDQSAWPLLVNGKEISYSPIDALIEEKDFQEHAKTSSTLGFTLFVKRARIGQAKHVRVRPRFDNWEASGSITVFDETITKDVLQMILLNAGQYCGIGDWRPSSPKSPGPWGKFIAEVA